MIIVDKWYNYNNTPKIIPDQPAVDIYLLTKFWRSEVSTRDWILRRILRVCVLGRVEAQYYVAVVEEPGCCIVTPQIAPVTAVTLIWQTALTFKN